jgi:hypothetical protein
MKKIYLTVLAFAAMFFAVDAYAQLGVGVGYNLLNTTQKLADESDDESLNGLYVEATYDFNFLEAKRGSLAVQPGLRYSFAGETESEKMPGLTTRASLTEHYLDIPVNVKYSYDIMPSTLKAYAFAGPVFSMGLTSVSKTSLSGEGVNYVSKYHNYSGKTVVKGEGTSSSVKPDGLTDYGRFDIKLGLGIGAAFSEKLNVKLGYEIGMLNRYTGEQISKDYRYRMHTGVFYLGVGLSF